MTDIEKLKKTFEELGIDYDTGEQYQTIDPMRDAIYVGEYIGRTTGYGRLFACFLFDMETGKFIEAGVWE